ncbi:MAG: hypothetical protein JWR70_3420 [Modestobacter sp.]|nr:hypothetical protein [Modestobacter sp.]
MTGVHAATAQPPQPAAGHRRRTGRRLVVLTAAVLVAVAAVVVAHAWPRESFAVDCLAVGAQVRGPSGDVGTAAFVNARSTLGPLTVRRSFDSSLPATFTASAARADAAAGVRSFVSWKPPGGDFRGAADGRYDRQVTAWARSVPRTGVYATAFHEPENDMTAAEFVALQRHLYSVVKAANPTIHWGPVYMAYWWDPGEPSHYVGDPAAWWPGDDAADFAGLDWYSAQPQPMTSTSAFETWYRTMSATSAPLYITEYGQYAVGPGAAPEPRQQRARAAAIRTDAEWITAHRRIRMWLYWNSTGDQGDWRLADPASQRAWRGVAAVGCSG